MQFLHLDCFKPLIVVLFCSVALPSPFFLASAPSMMGCRMGRVLMTLTGPVVMLYPLAMVAIT